MRSAALLLWRRLFVIASPLHFLRRAAVAAYRAREGLVVAAATSACRIRLSPIRKVEIPMREPREIGRRIQAAFGDDQIRSRGILWRQPFADRQRGLEGPQIAIVDADQARFQLERAVQFNFIMNFNQHIHAVFDGCLLRSLVPRRRRRPP